MASQSQPVTATPDGATESVEPAAALGPLVAYLVTGSTGEYSDRSEWPVGVWWTEAEAQAYVEFLGEQRQRLPRLKGYDWETGRTIEKAMRAFDPGFSEDYTGTVWFVTPVAVAAPPADAARSAHRDSSDVTDPGRTQNPPHGEV